MTFLAILGLLIAALLAACSPAAPAVPEATAGPDPVTASATPSPTPATVTPVRATITPMGEPDEDEEMNTPPPEVEPETSPLVEQARQDLARRLDVVAAEVELVTFESVVWPDASLGCPQPGMAYAQVLRDGYRIQLRAAGKSYSYHGGGSRGPFLCENPTAPSDAPGFGDD